MRKPIRQRLNYRASQLSVEGRVRQLAHDLLDLVDDCDNRALAQSAVLRDAATPKPKPAPQPTSLAREVAYGRIVMPAMDLGKASERERVLARRQAFREGDWTPPYGEACAFEREERARYAAASEMLRRGVADGDICAKLHLEESEITDIRDQLKM